MTDSRSWLDLVMAINRESPALRVASRNVALSIRCQRSATWTALGREFPAAFAVDYIKQARVLVVALTQDKNLGQLSSNRPRKQLANKLHIPSESEWQATIG